MQKINLIQKYFTATHEIDTDGQINGINPFEVITLDQPQHITAETTFHEMEVLKRFEVNGTITGKKLEEFLPNPTLDRAEEIIAGCSFKKLTVEGEIKVEDSFSGKNLEAVLSDAVYDDHEENVIRAPKVFKNLEITKNTNIVSNFINNINLKSIMTTHGEQEVSIEKFLGDVWIKNLRLLGLFDSVNATELEMNSVRTFGDQFIGTPLLFVDGGKIGADSVFIEKSLNEIPVENFIYLDQGVELPQNAQVEVPDLSIENLRVNEDIVGSGSLANMNLHDLRKNHVSKSHEQTMNVPVEIDKLVTRKTFSGTNINGQPFDRFKNYMIKIKNFSKSLLSGEQKIDTLIVDGNANMNFINDKNMEELMNSIVWLDRSNSFNEVIFLDDIKARNLVVRDSVNGKNFATFIDNWIPRTENPVKISKDIVFENDLIVAENLEVKEINNINFGDFFRKRDVVQVDR